MVPIYYVQQTPTPVVGQRGNMLCLLEPRWASATRAIEHEALTSVMNLPNKGKSSGLIPASLTIVASTRPRKSRDLVKPAAWACH
jgi:hypothetical protein